MTNPQDAYAAHITPPDTDDETPEVEGHMNYYAAEQLGRARHQDFLAEAERERTIRGDAANKDRGILKRLGLRRDH